MSLLDLVPIALQSRMPRRAVGNTIRCLRWREKNREKWLAYRREWYAKRSPK